MNSIVNEHQRDFQFSTRLVQNNYHVQYCHYCRFIYCNTRVLASHCWQHFHFIRVLEASQQTQANFLSSYQLLLICLLESQKQ